MSEKGSTGPSRGQSGDNLVDTPSFPFLIRPWVNFQKDHQFKDTGNRRRVKWSSVFRQTMTMSMSDHCSSGSKLSHQNLSWTDCMSKSCWYHAERVDDETQFKLCIPLWSRTHTDTHTHIFVLPSSFSSFYWLIVGGLLFWNAYFLPLLFFCLGPRGEWKLAMCDECAGGRLWSSAKRERILPRIAKEAES